MAMPGGRAALCLSRSLGGLSKLSRAAPLSRHFAPRRAFSAVAATKALGLGRSGGQRRAVVHRLAVGLRWDLAAGRALRTPVYPAVGRGVGAQGDLYRTPVRGAVHEPTRSSDSRKVASTSALNARHT